MKYFPTGSQMKEADRYTIEYIGLPSMVLMERAALQVVETLEKKNLDLSRVLVVCGSGNNGGDGYAVARLLYLKGHQVEICFVGNETSRSEENRRQKEIAEYYKVPVVEKLEKDEYSVVIDAIFGIGLKREIEGNYFEVIKRLNGMKGTKVAVDIPSGIHDTTGDVKGIAFKADITVAIAFVKRGLIFYPGYDYAGEIIVGDIGITGETLEKDEMLACGFDMSDLKERFPKRIPNTHKGSYGKVLLIVGSKGMSGAAFLCAKAAYAVGAGLVQIYTTEDNRTILQQLLPEAIVSTYTRYDEEQLQQLLRWADVIGIGSGLGKSSTSVQIVKYVLDAAECTCVVDADALNIISEHMEWLNNRKQELILTPHMKEMARLLACPVKELSEGRVPILNEFVSKHAVVCVLKDARTLVAKHGEHLYMNLSGNAAMAKGGSGDVLTGVITGIAAQKTDSYNAASLGVYLHGLAGDVARDKNGNYSVLASDIIDGISGVLKQI